MAPRRLQPRRRPSSPLAPTAALAVGGGQRGGLVANVGAAATRQGLSAAFARRRAASSPPASSAPVPVGRDELARALFHAPAAETDGAGRRAVSLDGGRFVTATADTTARQVWDAASGRSSVATLDGHTAPVVQSAAFSPDGGGVVTGAEDRPRRAPLGRRQRAGARANSPATADSVFRRPSAPMARSVVTASADKTAQSGTPPAARSSSHSDGHANRVSSAAFSPDGERIVTAASDDSTACLGTPRSEAELASLDGGTGLGRPPRPSAPMARASSPPAATQTGARLGRRQRGRPPSCRPRRAGPLGGLQPRRPARRHRQRRQDRPHLGRRQRPGARHPRRPHRQGQRRRLQPRWAAASSPPAPTTPPASGTPPAARNFASSPATGSTRRPSAPTATDRHRQPGQHRRVWDAASGAVLRSITDPPGRLARLQPRWQPHRSRRSTTPPRGAASGKELVTLAGDTGTVQSAAFSPDGTSSSPPATTAVQLWDAAGGRLLATLAGASGVRSAAFSPDGKTIVTAGVDTTARVWDAAPSPLSPSEVAAFVRERVSWRLVEGRLLPTEQP